MRELQEERVSINFHHFCLTPANFTRYGMGNFWTPLSINWDRQGLEYISTIEAKNYPFVGVQFHPEKNVFEWSPKELGSLTAGRQFMWGSTSPPTLSTWPGGATTASRTGA